jgi:hypothetical protein
LIFELQLLKEIFWIKKSMKLSPVEESAKMGPGICHPEIKNPGIYIPGFFMGD